MNGSFSVLCPFLSSLQELNACEVITSLLLLPVLLLVVLLPVSLGMRIHLWTEEETYPHERRKLGRIGGSMNLAAQPTRQKHALTTMLATSTGLRFSPFQSFHFRECHPVVLV